MKTSVLHATAFLAAVLALSPPWPSSSCTAETLYGVTALNLVTIDPVDPANVTIVGPHNLSLRPFSLAYDPKNGVMAGTAITTSGNTRRLIHFDLSTGSGTDVASLGDSQSGFYEGIEYVDSLATFVAGFDDGPSAGNADKIRTVDLFGNTSPVVTTTPPIDNDAAVYDSTRGIFYTLDAKGTNELRQVNLMTGAHEFRASIPLLTDQSIAYSAELDVIFLEAGGELYRADAAAPTSFTLVGAITGSRVLGLAFVIPEPKSLFLLAWCSIVGMILVKRRDFR